MPLTWQCVKFSIKTSKKILFLHVSSISSEQLDEPKSNQTLFMSLCLYLINIYIQKIKNFILSFKICFSQFDDFTNINEFLFFFIGSLNC